MFTSDGRCSFTPLIAPAVASVAMIDGVPAYGCKVTEVRDRCYFTSIYFREPGGVLFEVATVKPGFTVDEELQNLGTALKLPPWEEPHRRDIEAGLTPIVIPYSGCPGVLECSWRKFCSSSIGRS